VEKFKPCPYCGVLFSGKYGTEKRKQSRIKKEIPFVFAHNGQRVEACTMDVSDRGICLKIFGSPSLPVGETIDFKVNDINVKAQVMWFTNNSEVSSSLTGLKIVDGFVNAL
jgi:PilZ domain